MSIEIDIEYTSEFEKDQLETSVEHWCIINNVEAYIITDNAYDGPLKDGCINVVFEDEKDEELGKCLAGDFGGMASEPF